MRPVHEILRLKHERGASERQIAALPDVSKEICS